MNPARRAAYDLFSDFEGTLVIPEISYRDCVLPRVAELEKFQIEYDARLKLAREERTEKAWAHYLDLYSKLFTSADFAEMALKYSMNKTFQSWCKRFLRARSYDGAVLNVITRGFAPVVRRYFDRTDAKAALAELRISLGGVFGAEPYFDKQGLMKGLKSVVYSKKRFVKDGHVMLGDDGEIREFASYPYFVNLEKFKNES